MPNVSMSQPSIFTHPVQLSDEPPGGRSGLRSTLGAWCALVGVLVLLSTAYGVWKTFSPVPYMDQWDGMIGFWRRLQQGDAGAWWAQHNEHRILFSRVLFWIDIKYFEGLSAFLVGMNVLLHLGIAVTFIIAYARYGETRRSLPVVIGVVLTLRMAWMQEDNLIWGFQSQFIAVYLFATLGFLCFCLSRKTNSLSLQLSAIGFAGLSMASMSNGLLVFPLLIATGFVLRLPRTRLLLVVLASGLAWAAYFVGYVSPPFHASPVDGLLHHLPTVVHFALVFLGSPFFFLGANSGVAVVGALLLTVFAGASRHTGFSWPPRSRSLYWPRYWRPADASILVSRLRRRAAIRLPR
jgi:hypothetical protein